MLLQVSAKLGGCYFNGAHESTDYKYLIWKVGLEKEDRYRAGKT
jgi:hypothetical protein